MDCMKIKAATPHKMSGYSEISNDHGKMFAEETGAQTKPEQDPYVLQEDIEMSSGSRGSDFNGNYTSENYSSGHGSHSNEYDENERDSAVLMESLDCQKRWYSVLNVTSFLTIANSEHNPSTSGCRQATKSKARKELMKTLQELKVHLPLDKRIKGKSSILATLKYALRSIKQVKANEEYYQLLMINKSHPSGLDVSTYTVEEVENITSEYIFKNSDMFAVAVSLITGEIFAGKEHENGISYHLFRMTPYLIKVQDAENSEDQRCCVLLAEKVHSGYEAPRIPPDKQIFTTTHTPSCLFQDVDESCTSFGIPTLIGTPVLVHLHPSDRPLMLAIHKKILQYGGQPFDYSPIRFCTRNGEYITLDTSWSSFINPWSQKVSFIIGRHKVRMGPLNEDVFSAPHYTEDKILHPSVQEITEQIYRLLLQPVRNSGSSGYGSLGSSGSHEHLMSVVSSSDSNGNNNEDTQKDKPVLFCWHNANLSANTEQLNGPNIQLKAVATATGKDTGSVTAQNNVVTEELTWEEQPMYSYQQINCLDSVIRYLESCNVPGTVKRKCEPSPNAASLDSDVHRQKTTDNTIKSSGVVEMADKSNGSPVVGACLTSLALPGKPESVISFTSQCTYSSTIVHVGDKKTQCELEIIEDGPSGTETLDSQPLTLQSNGVHTNQEKEPFKKLGLTKKVLAVHTQKEEQNLLNKFKEIKRFNIFQFLCNYYLQERSKGRPGEHGTCGLRNSGSCVDLSWMKSGKNRKSKSKRIKPHESSDSTTSGTKLTHRFPLLGLNSTAWSPSDTSQASYPSMPFPAVMPAYPQPVFPTARTVPPGPEVSLSGLNESQDSGNNCPMPPSQFPAPSVTLVLPNYVYPQINNGISQTLYPDQPSFSVYPPFSSQTVFSAQTPFTAPSPFLQQTVFPTQPFHYNPPAESEKTPVMKLQNELSRSSTPQSLSPQDQASPPLFQSRFSSPLQLNLLQLEEMPKPAENVTAADLIGCQEALTDGSAASPMEVQNSDALSMSSDFLDILFQEDACSGTGSASSGSGVSATTKSLGSGSNGCDMSASGTGSSETTHTSKYFGSIDSLENNHKTKKNTEMEESEHFIKYVLHDPMWLLMANTDDAVMMTYQIPSGNLETVLKEDKQKLKQMQKFQPKGIPKAVANSECIYCEDKLKSSCYEEDDEEIHDMELIKVIEANGENNLVILSQVREEQT
uniref:Period circadian protein homolog 2 n=1 Tax=Sphenodon punctatus TaxID=8508 RepID=A0A8D0GD46_SPHPU